VAGTFKFGTIFDANRDGRLVHQATREFLAIFLQHFVDLIARLTPQTAAVSQHNGR
jgi:hypothetical protein